MKRCLILLAFAPMLSMAQTNLDKSVASIKDSVITWRRAIHQHPELSNREFKTSAFVAAHLKKLGLEVDTGVGKTGVVAILKGGKPGPVVALRADMDALPLKEKTGLSYSSRKMMKGPSSLLNRWIQLNISVNRYL